MVDIKQLTDAVLGFRLVLSALDGNLEDMSRKLGPLDATASPDFETQTPLISPSAPITRACRDGVERVWLYVLGCAGCRRLSNEYGHPVYKIGITSDPDFDKRMTETQGDHYAGTIRIGETIVTEPGFEKWVTLAIATSGHSSDSAIEILPRAIAIELPMGMTERSFDAAPRKALGARALHRRVYAGKPERLTAYVTGGNKEHPRLNRATEIYEFAPRDQQDGDMLLRTIAIILRAYRQSKN